jgi:hypothetical protein
LTEPKPSDARDPAQCDFCGMLPLALSLPHRTPFDCVQDLRARLGEKELRAWTGPRNGGRPKKRAAAAG